jgi:hypothetical protein
VRSKLWHVFDASECRFSTTAILMTSNQPLSRADVPPLLTLALHAAASDAVPDATRRRAIRQTLEDLAQTSNATALLQQAEALTVGQAAAQSAATGGSALAFEIAVCVCNADRLRRDAETLFLADLGGRLALTQPQIVGAAALADAIATAPAPERQTPAAPGRAELTRMIRGAALRAARLQALRQPNAILAIGVVQDNVLYALGTCFGLDPVVEYLRSLAAGLLRAATASVPGAAGPEIQDHAFGTTFALGHAVRRAYARGWSQDAVRLRADFNRLRAVVCRLNAARWPSRCGAPRIESDEPGIESDKPSIESDEPNIESDEPNHWQAGNAKLCVERGSGRVDLRVGAVCIALNAFATLHGRHT